MKKIILLTFGILFLFSALSYSQINQALGLRIGGGNAVGVEINYQTPIQDNRLELGLGFGNHSHWDFWKLAGIYQWVMPIDNGFNWYLGAGATLGNWSYDGPYNVHDEGISLALALNAGVEYNFDEIPLQLSLDTRPELFLVQNGDDSWFGLALGIRYVF